MDMHAKHQDQLIFHLTGKRAGDGLTAIDGLGIRPALLAPYRELSALRHDFPIVLSEPGRRAVFVHTLSELIDAMLKDIAPRGIGGERLRRHALQLEQEIRRAIEAGATGRLSELWESAVAALGAREGQTVEQVLSHAGGALHSDGEVLGCSQDMPARLITHAWQAAQREKARLVQTDLSRLVLKLSDILRAARSYSQAGRQPQSLRASVGGPHQAAFDFEMLSHIVGKGVPLDELPATRRARLVRTLAILESQRVFAVEYPESAPASAAAHGYVFDNCAAAAAAFRQRLPDIVALAKAMSIAELEAGGKYIESEHDLFFEAFEEDALTADDLARFPDYLVCIPPDRNDAPENANLIDMLSSGLPVKVLVQSSDLLEEASIGTGHFAFGVRSSRLAMTAMGLGGMYVLQCAGSNLYALRGQIAQGVGCRGPALFSVFTAAQRPRLQLPAYLMAAAAMQSRAFPAFSYDAAAGDNQATRFSLENNPQPEDDWPVQTLEYSDCALQRVSQACAFTFADFALCDDRFAGHFALVARERWNAQMLPAAEWLALGEAASAHRVPYLLAVDPDNALQRVIVDMRMMLAARRCLLLWQRLQECGGVHDSHAEQLLARERAAWAVAQQTVPATPAAAAVSVPESTAAPEATHSRDEAWIDTARCPSCDECQLINKRMFAYDERKQAFLKDISAGSYRQLVEAAESCQVAIIHPGKPRDPNEPGLDELLLRAEPFR